MAAMADVFISYSSLDRSRISVLADRLENEGFSVWWDPEILPGEDFQKVIGEALEAAVCVIVAWSSNSIRSTWVKSEAAAANGRDALVPVYLEMVSIPVPFNILQTVHLVDWDGDPEDTQWKRLVKAVRYRSARVSVEPDQGQVIGGSIDPEPIDSEPIDPLATLPLGPGIARLIEEATDSRRKTHPYLGLHHWLVALLDRHPGLVKRMAPDLDCGSLSREFERKMSEEEDFGEELESGEVIELADRRARDREAERVWESDVAAVILAAAGLMDA